MSTTTTNYGLVKPALTDAPPDITAMNPNWDTIDAQLKSLNDKVSTPQKITPEGIGAAPANHGNHVPATQTANNATFLRNDNTWQKVTPANIGAAAISHGNHVPTTQTADNATFLRNDNTWQKVTPANIGAAESNHGHDLEELGTVKLYRYLEQLELTTATATTNAIMQAMDVNSIAILDVTTSWTAATEIPSKYSTMVLYKRYNGRTTGTLTAVASEHIWFGSQHSGGSFAGWKEQYGEHNLSALATALGAAKVVTGSYGSINKKSSATVSLASAPKAVVVHGPSCLVVVNDNTTIEGYSSMSARLNGTTLTLIAGDYSISDPIRYVAFL